MLEGLLVGDDIRDADRGHIMTYLECLPKMLDFPLKQW